MYPVELRVVGSEGLFYSGGKGEVIQLVKRPITHQPSGLVLNKHYHTRKRFETIILGGSN